MAGFHVYCPSVITMTNLQICQIESICLFSDGNPAWNLKSKPGPLWLLYSQQRSLHTQILINTSGDSAQPKTDTLLN